MTSSAFISFLIFSLVSGQSNIGVDPILAKAKTGLERNAGGPAKNVQEKEVDPLKKYGEMTYMKGGIYRIGSDSKLAKKGESPAFQISVDPFHIDVYPVTNVQYGDYLRRFEGYKPIANKVGYSLVFKGHLDDDFINQFTKPSIKLHHLHHDLHNHFVPIIAASWEKPHGPYSSIEKKMNHPVVHVSQPDAIAYCASNGKRLPTEFEWEYAARGSLVGAEFPWGQNVDYSRANLWRGTFPKKDWERKHGHNGTTPVDFFPPQNDFGLFDVVGNVWEWTSTKDHNRFQLLGDNDFIMRGASYLDGNAGHIFARARVYSRWGMRGRMTTSNIGFRCAKTVRKPIKHTEL